ncbi:hypothetical protein EJ08DRAFT_700355 [Tothia fuscella]|uniref:Uncharacterized protein n=1 Tax=Tothia fuscella TaxID=1048955 RepID=A0A9P4NLA0_9PEZI|nr:hypothetical protein EJ08DRAFT_700355 [Tothia fuscella]
MLLHQRAVQYAAAPGRVFSMLLHHNPFTVTGILLEMGGVGIRAVVDQYGRQINGLALLHNPSTVMGLTLETPKPNATCLLARSLLNSYAIPSTAIASSPLRLLQFKPRLPSLSSLTLLPSIDPTSALPTSSRQDCTAGNAVRVHPRAYCGIQPLPSLVRKTTWLVPTLELVKFLAYMRCGPWLRIVGSRLDWWRPRKRRRRGQWRTS